MYIHALQLSVFQTPREWRQSPAAATREGHAWTLALQWWPGAPASHDSHEGPGHTKGVDASLSLSISLSFPLSLSVKVLLYPGLHCVVFSLATPRCIGQKYLDSVPQGWPCDALCYPPLALGTGAWRSAPHFIGLDVGGVKDSSCWTPVLTAGWNPYHLQYH